MKQLFTLLLFLLYVGTQLMYSQIREGKITYRTIYTSDAVDSSLTTFTFSEDQFRTENQSKNMYSIALIDKKTEDVLILIKGPQGRQAFHANLPFIRATEPPQVKYDAFTETRQKKNILGFRCKLMKGVDVFGNENHFWYTEDIEYGTETFGVPKEVPGIALEYTLNTFTGSHHYKAIEYTPGAPEPAVFEQIVPPGYTFQDLVKIQSKEEQPPVSSNRAQGLPVASNIRYPSGEIGLQEYIRATIRYPEECRRKGEIGLVSVEVVVAPDGIPESQKIVMYTGEPKLLCDEALRIVKSIPRWVPAINEKGESIRSSRIVMVRFKLPGQ